MVRGRHPNADPSTLRQAGGHGPAACVHAGGGVLPPFLGGEREDAEGEGERRDGRRRRHGHHILAPVGARAHLASRVPSPPPRAGDGDELWPFRGIASTGQGGATRVHGQHGGGRRREGHRRRAPRQRAGLGGVAAEPRRGGVGRRGEREAHGGGVAGEAELHDGGGPAERRRDGDLRLAAVRRVGQRLRVGEAGGRPERRREQGGREDDGVRGARRREHGGGDLPGTGGAREASRRRGVHERGDCAAADTSLTSVAERRHMVNSSTNLDKGKTNLVRDGQYPILSRHMIRSFGMSHFILDLFL